MHLQGQKASVKLIVHRQTDRHGDLKAAITAKNC